MVIGVGRRARCLRPSADVCGRYAFDAVGPFTYAGIVIYPAGEDDVSLAKRGKSGLNLWLKANAHRPDFMQPIPSLVFRPPAHFFPSLSLLPELAQLFQQGHKSTLMRQVPKQEAVVATAIAQISGNLHGLSLVRRAMRKHLSDRSGRRLGAPSYQWQSQGGDRLHSLLTKS